VVCPSHAHKKCRDNRKCSPDKKSLLVWASAEELIAMKKRMHDLMAEHRKLEEEEGLVAARKTTSVSAPISTSTSISTPALISAPPAVAVKGEEGGFLTVEGKEVITVEDDSQ
jgi:hypothetical protein